MTVHFIGAGPGAADLITVRGRDLLARCPVCLYAGSIVPPDMLAWCRPDALLVDTAPMTLDEIEAEYVAAHAAGHDVARLHSGDLSVFSAVAEQIRRLSRRGIPYTLTPGVPAFAAAAAALHCELTVPEIAQSVVLTRMPGRASRMPEGERLAAFAATSATLVVHLAIQAIETILAKVTPFYGAPSYPPYVYAAPPVYYTPPTYYGPAIVYAQPVLVPDPYDPSLYPYIRSTGYAGSYWRYGRYPYRGYRRY